MKVQSAISDNDTDFFHKNPTAFLILYLKQHLKQDLSVKKRPVQLSHSETEYDFMLNGKKKSIIIEFPSTQNDIIGYIEKLTEEL